MITVIVKSVFHLERHKNNIFFIFKKIIFDIGIYLKHKKKLILSKKINFLENTVSTGFQTLPKTLFICYVGWCIQEKKHREEIVDRG